MANKKNTDTGIVEATGFAVLANMDILNEAMAEDCQGMEFTFDRVKLPAGGGTAFELPAADGEEAEMVKEITGVIVYNHPAYALYMDKYAGGNNRTSLSRFLSVSETLHGQIRGREQPAGLRLLRRYHGHRETGREMRRLPV